MSTSKGKVFVIGLDGATFDLARTWIDEGRLPNLAGLMREGVHGELASTIPPISAAAWASFSTGLNPGKHGIYHFRQHVPGTYRQKIATGGDRKGKSLWRILSDHGKKVIVVNIVMTYPPEQVNGFLVSGLDSPGTGSNYTCPAELREELGQAVRGYVIEPDLAQFARRDRYDLVYRNIISCLEARNAAVEYLLDKYEYDFFAVNFRATDLVQHHFWKFINEAHPLYDEAQAREYGHCIRSVYEKLDRIVGELLTRCDDQTTVVVMSDHGFGTDSARTVYLNRWLQEQGWLSFVGGGDEGGGLRQVFGKIEQGARGLLRKLIWDFARQHAPQGLKDLLKRELPDLTNTLKSPTTYHAIRWAQTVAYSDEHRSNIWINLKGREPEGIVEPGAEYEALRDEIIERLRTLHDPETGTAVFSEVYRREELYPGQQVGVTPDIHMVLTQDPLYVSRPSRSAHGSGSVATLTPKQLSAGWLISGRHRPNGVFVMKGPGIVRGRALTGLSIMDLAPTILTVMGHPVLDSMDGRVIEEAFTSTPEVRSEHDDSGEEPSSNGGVYSEAEEDEVADRLHGLGYI